MDFTEEQKKVIESRNKNILVSAAAGSGKTAVLVERIVQRVLDKDDPVDIDRILTVTFTNAAAHEMRERIRKRLSEAMLAEKDNRRIREQIGLLTNANIMTIDSFCVRILRENFEELGIDPLFRVGDENETELIREEVCDEILNEAYEEGDEEFFKFLDMCSPGKEDRDIAESIMALSRAADSRTEPEEWLDALIYPYEDNKIEGSVWAGAIMSISDAVLKEAIKSYERLIRLANSPGGPYMYAELLSEEKERLTIISDCNTYEERYEGLYELKYRSLPSKRDETVDPGLRERVKNVRTKEKEEMVKLKDELFGKYPGKALSDMQSAYPAVKELIKLTKKFRERFSEKKEKKNVLDFSDIEHMALKIVRGEAGESYRDYFKEIMTDEYQDSNGIQEAILTGVSRENNYFCVGDVKQSIYSFRLAEPGIFMSRFKSYEADPVSERILLNRNFRSEQRVISSVNSLFRLIMHEETGGVEYDSSQELYYGGAGAETEDGDVITRQGNVKRDGGNELVLIESDKDEDAEGVELEAAYIASRIEEMKDTHKYSDFCILMRSVSGTDEKVRDVLLSRGIPAVTEARSGYFKTSEIRDVLNFLSVIDNPRQDIALIALMKSPFGAFNDEELSIIRASSEDGLFYDALIKGNLPDELRERADAFLDKINRYRDMLPYTPIHELIRLIIEDGYLNLASAAKAGARDNLELLIKRAADYEKTSYRGLFRFLRYIERMKKHDMDFAEAAKSGGTDAVRIMSIHKSKGLEFPVVFLANVSKQFNRSDTAKDVITHRELGLGISFTEPDSRIKRKSVLKSAIGYKTRLDSIGEELRILYVALTRAKEKFIITGVTKDADKLLSKSCSVSRANSYMDFFMAALQTDENGDMERDFEIRRVDASDLITERIIKGSDLSDKRNEIKAAALLPETERVKKIRESLKFIYPHEKAIFTMPKVSVSELKLRDAGFEDEDIEDFAQDITGLLSEETGTEKAGTEGARAEEGLAEETFAKEALAGGSDAVDREKIERAARRGTAFHKAVSLLPPDPGTGVKAAGDFLRGLCEKGSLLKEEKELIDAKDIASFLETGLFKRMNEALKRGELFREQPFIIAKRASDVLPGAPDDEKIQIQGIIDAFFIEEGGICVMDYKTDHVFDEEVLKKRYRKQLKLYADALTQLTGLKVREKKLYSVFLKREIDIA